MGAFLYVLGCREPLPGLHEQYVAARWRQVLGSTMHCVAGDGLGILVGATIASFLALPYLADLALEYVLGFLFGWTIFQALFMRAMAGSYARSLKSTFIPEFLSMNFLMTGMVPVAALGRKLIGVPLSPLAPAFWFVMSMALLTGFIIAYPINWWLVANSLKHGMIDGAATHDGPSARHADGRRCAGDEDGRGPRSRHEASAAAVGGVHRRHGGIINRSFRAGDLAGALAQPLLAAGGTPDFQGASQRARRMRSVDIGRGFRRPSGLCGAGARQARCGAVRKTIRPVDTPDDG